MNISKLKTGFFALALGLTVTACSSDKDPQPEPTETTKDKYVLITMSDNNLNKPGFATAFDELPNGNIVNNSSESTQGLGFGGWRPYGNWLFKMFKTSDNSLGIERLDVALNGKISSGGFISTDKTNGSGNFVIVDDNKGFYWDGSKPTEIQIFNPTKLERSSSIDFTDVINKIGKNEENIKFRAIGQKFLAVKDGKLFANITYATTDGTQKGFWDDFYPDVYIAVIDIATGKHEKTIKIEDTGAIAYVNDNQMYDFDSNGDLYIVTQGTSEKGTGGNSKISRIKAKETEIDKDWSLNMDDIQVGGKFVSVFAKDGKIITVIPNTALTGGPTGNINFSNIWEFYSIDIATKKRTKIEGVPTTTNPGAAMAAIEIDGKILLRVNTEKGVENGYYELNGNTAKQLFQVTAGGSVSGLYKIKVTN